MEPGSLRWIGAAALLGAAVQLAACKSENTALPALGAELGATSVSGLSAGAYMAGQFQIAHSSIVRGAGIIAGGPYGCAESAFADVMPGPGAPFMNLSKAINGCMLDAMQKWGIPNPEKLAERARKLAAVDRIDATDGMAQTRVYLFSGTNDRVVLPSIVAAAAKLYSALGVPEPQVKLVSDIGAGHAFVTTDKGLACGRTGEPYITDCDYDQAGTLLAHIYGELQAAHGAADRRVRRLRPAGVRRAIWPGMASPTPASRTCRDPAGRARAAACMSSSTAAISSAPRPATRSSRIRALPTGPMPIA